MSCAGSLCLLVRSWVPAGTGSGIACPGPSLTGAMEAAARELGGDVRGAARSGAPSEAGGVDVSVAGNRAETLNRV
jgi:hypothetical protein